MFNSSFVNIAIFLEMILNIFLALEKIWKKPKADIFNIIQTQTTYSQQNNKLWEVDGKSKRWKPYTCVAFQLPDEVFS